MNGVYLLLEGQMPERSTPGRNQKKMIKIEDEKWKFLGMVKNVPNTATRLLVGGANWNMMCEQPKSNN